MGLTVDVSADSPAVRCVPLSVMLESETNINIIHFASFVVMYHG